MWHESDPSEKQPYMTTGTSRYRMSFDAPLLVLALHLA